MALGLIARCFFSGSRFNLIDLTQPCLAQADWKTEGPMQGPRGKVSWQSGEPEAGRVMWDAVRGGLGDHVNPRPRSGRQAPTEALPPPGVPSSPSHLPGKGAPSFLSSVLPTATGPARLTHSGSQLVRQKGGPGASLKPPGHQGESPGAPAAWRPWRGGHRRCRSSTGRRRAPPGSWGLRAGWLP